MAALARPATPPLFGSALERRATRASCRGSGHAARRCTPPTTRRACARQDASIRRPTLDEVFLDCPGRVEMSAKPEREQAAMSAVRCPCKGRSSAGTAARARWTLTDGLAAAERERPALPRPDLDSADIGSTGCDGAHLRSASSAAQSPCRTAAATGTSWSLACSSRSQPTSCPRWSPWQGMPLGSC